MEGKRKYIHIEIANSIEVGMNVIIPSAAGDLRASLFIGEGSNEKYPAVIIVNGSRAISYRKDWLPGANGMWRPITELLHSNGYAVLLLEKRGINGSAGHWELQSFEDRAADVKAAIEYLRARKDIDSSRIGLIGHSQGGWIVQLASVMYPKDVAYVLNLAGPSTTVMEQMLDTNEMAYTIEGLSPNEIRQKMRRLKRRLKFYYHTAPILKPKVISHIIRYDAETIRKNITAPIFSIYAENDRYVPAHKNRDLMVQSLKLSGNPNYETHIIPGANHDFKPAEISTPNEQLTDVPISDDFLGAIKQFILWAATRRAPLHGLSQW